MFSFKNLAPKIFSRKYLPLFLSALLVVSVFVTILISQENQDRRSRASETIATEPGSYGFSNFNGNSYGESLASATLTPIATITSETSPTDIPPTDTPTPIPTATPLPSNTPTPIPTSTSSPTSTPNPTSTPTPTPLTNAWQSVTGCAKDIGIGGNGAVWTVGCTTTTGGYAINGWIDSGWSTISGGGVRISVDAQGYPWIINNKGAIYRRVSTGWQKLSGCAKDIGISGNGSVWIIGCNSVAGGYGVYKWSGSSWSSISGGGIKISVDPQGYPWIINNKGAIYRRVSTGWQKLSGCAKDIGVANNGNAWIISCDTKIGGWGIYQWNGSGWVSAWTNGARDIAAGPNGLPWVVNSSNAIYKKLQ